VQQKAPIPLGGTSNHFKTDILRELGGWDPFNVTEDADLGIRLYRHGYRTVVLDSVTLEEANSDAINWIKQRSRWYKGYLQTWLVHTRNPIAMIREVGLGPFLRFNLFVGGTPLLALLNPVFWSLTLMWFVAELPFIQRLFPTWLYFAGLTCLVLGNFAFVYSNVVAARTAGIPQLVSRAVLSPAYWMLMSIAAFKALLQLVVAPSFWEKTTHGLGPVVMRTGSQHAS
jgi:cellulose synthase/poly-beta-1,6-N-acetylglucosamine synthase-like glycosyltransferase